MQRSMTSSTAFSGSWTENWTGQRQSSWGLNSRSLLGASAAFFGQYAGFVWYSPQSSLLSGQESVLLILCQSIIPISRAPFLSLKFILLSHQAKFIQDKKRGSMNSLKDWQTIFKTALSAYWLTGHPFSPSRLSQRAMFSEQLALTTALNGCVRLSWGAASDKLQPPWICEATLSNLQASYKGISW